MIRTSWYYYVSIVLMTKPVVVVILLLWFFYRMMIAEKKPKGEREKVHSKTLLQLDSVLPFFACGLLARPIHDVWVTTLFQALMEQHIVLSKNHSDHHRRCPYFRVYQTFYICAKSWNNTSNSAKIYPFCPKSITKTITYAPAMRFLTFGTYD